ncbi:MAG: L-seryl-tRNA(Sec) selenium transferase [Acidimicrobiia bacterium]|nr:L-seryl-tRNA(Sec) selenium transferase [Acidimicrobiia bacterium]
MELRDLPGVDSLAADLAARLPYPLPEPIVIEAARSAIDGAREEIVAGRDADPTDMALAALEPLATSRPRTVLNATGVLLHTNLGRAPLPPAAAAAAADHAVGYQNLEIDLATGTRGGRGSYVSRLLETLTGAEAALVVNNNAGALLLALAALSGGRRVLVSRGELIEIGGSFRLPNLMAASGAQLVEVGTTNRTRIADYEAAIDGAAAILKVHPSNYRVEGFTEDVGYNALAELARDRGLPFIADIGSGLLDEQAPWLAGPPPSWLSGEPGVTQTVALGATVTIFSGDKLLGGPQAGIAVGDAHATAAMRQHPIARALRIDGPTQTALVETLELYATGRGHEVPFWKMAAMGLDELQSRSEAVANAIGSAAQVVDSHSVPGAGSVPGEMIPSPAIRITGNADELWTALITANPPVLARRKEGSLEIDLRTLPQANDDRVAALIATALNNRREAGT